MTDGTNRNPDEPEGTGPPGPEQFMGNYELIRQIGRGAMGEVFLARHRKFALREYAIKLIRRDITTEAARLRFEREIVAMGGLVHPNLVYANDAGVDNDRMYLVMEYVRGKDLQHLIDDCGAFLAPQAADIVRQICSGVAHAHLHGVVHRDIKPANVLLSDDLEVKVLDLGIASLQSDRVSRMTRGDSLMGTAAFMAPELWEDALRVSPATDVYAIGCTAYCLIAGAPPFSDQEYPSFGQMMTAHQHADPQTLHLLRKDVSEDLSSVILKALHKDPDQRFSDAGEFAEQIKPYCQPLVKESDLFLGTSRSGTLDRTTPTTKLADVPSVGLGPWFISIVLLLIGGASLLFANLGGRVTAAWMLQYGRMGDAADPPLLGLGFDFAIIALATPLLCYLLARFYPNEVMRSFDLRHWSLPATFARIGLLIGFGILANDVSHDYWNIDQIPTRLAESSISNGGTGGAEQELYSTRWYVGYAIISYVILPTFSILFPLIWFVFGDLSRLQVQLATLLARQRETAFPGRMSENLHRFGINVRGQAARLIAVSVVAALMLHSGYWILALETAGVRAQVTIPGLMLFTTVLTGSLSIAFTVIAIVYMRGFHATSRMIAASGSIRDENELSKIGLGWLIKTTLLKRFTGIACLSIVLILGHSIWELKSASTESLQAEDLKTTTLPAKPATWLPERCEPGSNAQLVTVDVLGRQQTLYSEIDLRIDLPHQRADSADSRREPRHKIPFVLVPQTNADSETPYSFYIMKNKVSTILFRQFEESHPDDIDATAAQRRSESSLHSAGPAYNVTGREAFRFASKVCRGKLPTPNQWDAAFGRLFDEADAKQAITPFPYRLVEEAASGITFNDLQSSVNNRWSCLEMATLGKEYTRLDPLFPLKEVPDELELRGRSQSKVKMDGPLTLEEWNQVELPDHLYFGTRGFDLSSDEIAFRVVLEQYDE